MGCPSALFHDLTSPNLPAWHLPDSLPPSIPAQGEYMNSKLVFYFKLVFIATLTWFIVFLRIKSHKELDFSICFSFTQFFFLLLLFFARWAGNPHMVQF